MLTTIIIPRDLQVGSLWPEWAHTVDLSFQKLSFTFGVYLLALPILLEVPNIAFFLLDTQFFHFVGKVFVWAYLFHYIAVYLLFLAKELTFTIFLQQ